jgi:hypothetical protein
MSEVQLVYEVLETWRWMTEPEYGHGVAWYGAEGGVPIPPLGRHSQCRERESAESIQLVVKC